MLLLKFIYRETEFKLLVTFFLGVATQYALQLPISDNVLWIDLTNVSKNVLYLKMVLHTFRGLVEKVDYCNICTQLCFCPNSIW